MIQEKDAVDANAAATSPGLCRENATTKDVQVKELVRRRVILYRQLEWSKV